MSDDERPLFTVVLNTYNRAAVVPRAIDSVLAQDERRFEIVVVDDGSSDGTPQVVSGYDDPRLRYVRRDNGGLAVARNTGLEASRGRYVAFMDDDDVVEASWLADFAAIVEDGQAGAVTCGTRIATPTGETRERRLPRPLGPAFDDQTALFLPGTFVVRRDVLVAVGGYMETLRCSEQTELALRVLPYCVDHGLAVCHVSVTNVVTFRADDEDRPLRRPDYLHDGSLAVLDRHEDRMARDPQMTADFLAIAGVQAARMGDYREARRCLSHAVRRRPRAWRNYPRLVLAAFPPAGRKVWGTWREARDG